MTRIHLTRLFEWALKTIGRAVLYSTLAGVVLGLVAGFSGVFAIAWWSAVVCPAIFGAVLYQAQAPMPCTDEELEAADADRA